jgi:hypothetical protein
MALAISLCRRRAGAELIKAAKNDRKKRTFILVNNRLEGNALLTIAAILGIAADDLVNNSQLTTAANTVQMDSNGTIDQKTDGSSEIR